MIAGFLETTRGRITLDGRDITHMKPNKRGLGVVFQSYALFPHMSVADNVGFGLEMRNVDQVERKERMRDPYRSMFLLVILAPLLVSVVVRAFGWSMLLNSNGLVNQAFSLVGLGPYKLEYTTFAIVIALVHVMLPFMVIPVWTALQKLDPQTENAALSLMASPATTLRRIVLPQLTPGILSGSLMVFGLSASAFAIPGLLGGRRLKVAATAVYDEFLGSLNWPLGATIALLLLVANLIVMLTYYRVLERRYARSLG
ncbi:MAG: ABC-type spermidine/putrescine transport system, permease component I [uncultured Paraburkholderia sp.]|nr:MAG: ABC-type spermidine/putrescine transport system, permease component I [uncultured Paraburkholderia sp.]CAH2928275.1 MAG: ABC-type spermidine/putrescine transport system, permease component I [uncultured Paraburkholderia sp.]